MIIIKKMVEWFIKKYLNCWFYDIEISMYIMLIDVKQFVFEQEDFKVVDVKFNEDLMCSIFLQIIFEEESGGVLMFLLLMLLQIICFYGYVMQGMMGMYLEKNIQVFIDIQNKFVD